MRLEVRTAWARLIEISLGASAHSLFQGQYEEVLQDVYVTGLGQNWNEGLLWCSGKHSSCLAFILKSGRPLVCKAVIRCRGSHLAALVCLAVGGVISAKIENVKRVCVSLRGVLGTPSLPPFCHNDV